MAMTNYKLLSKKGLSMQMPVNSKRAGNSLMKMISISNNSEELSKVNKEDAAALCARGSFLSSHRDSEHDDGTSQIATTDQPTSLVYSETESELDVSFHIVMILYRHGICLASQHMPGLAGT